MNVLECMLEVEGRVMKVLLDTGSSDNFIREDLLRNPPREEGVVSTLESVTGHKLLLKGEEEVEIRLPSQVCRVKCRVLPKTYPLSCILGVPFLRKAEMQVD